METIDRLSVLIAAYKNTELVRRCIDSLVRAFGGRLPETVIIDDAAGDEPTRVLAESYAGLGVKFAVMPKNGGFAGANNFGYRLCSREYVVLVNSDTAFHEEPFSAMVKFLDEHPRVGIVSGKVIVSNDDPAQNGKLNGAGAMMSQYGIMRTRGWMADPSDPKWDVATPVFTAYGALFMFRNGLHEKVGGNLFYNHFHAYYEEVDLCHRTWLAGMEVWYVPTPAVDHAHGATMGKYVARASILRNYYRNIRFSFSTCWGVRGRLTIRPVFELLCLGQSLVQLFTGNATAIRAHWGALRDLWGMRKDLQKTRQVVQGFRCLNDTELFKHIVRRVSFSEFVGMVRGNI